MNIVQHVARLLFRFVFVWLVDIASLVVTSVIFPGIAFRSVGDTSPLVVAVAAALLLGAVNLLVRPVVLLLALPLGSFVIFGVGFVVNALVLPITANLLPGFEVQHWWDALLGGITLSAVNTILTGFTTLDDEDSFYQGLVERLAQQHSFVNAQDTGRGLVMLEIDGLSYHHIKQAIARGHMPTLKQMMVADGYQLSRVDCGLPSQTSACQAGILFGDNFDIPAFRWYDKDLQQLIVSSTDAPLINERYAKGHGLLRGGSSINNMLNGDATKSVLTLADIRAGSAEERQRRAEDIYLLMLNPYFFTRTLVLVFGDALREVWQAFKQRARNVQPRLNRLARLYPLARAATVVLMRDVATYLVTLDIIRGTPALYSTWVGYDEVAHHSGPWSSDAFVTLRQYDRVIARIRDVIARKAPRPYELIILSDHGQSFGATFKQRYGYDLKTFIEQHLPQGSTISHLTGGDDGMVSFSALAGEFDNMQAQRMGGRVGRVVVGGTQRAFRRRLSPPAPIAPPKPATVTAFGSGNLAQVYFDLYPRRITLNELNAAYPGMVDALVQHDGIGFVVAYADDGTPVVYGKRGARNLRTGDMHGDDPLKPYGDVALRAKQVRRVAEFPHAGDLMVMSTVYPDGTVAALEDLIGSHGGIGGEQTDAFIFHPADMRVPPTTNSTDFFALLNARRDLPPPPTPPTPLAPPELEAWSPANLGNGLRDVAKWFGLAVRAVALDRHAYRAVAADLSMTGPALLIGFASAVLASLATTGGFHPANILGRVGGWLVSVAIIFGAGLMLGGKSDFTRTLRANGFAQAARILDLLIFIPPVAPLARLLSQLLTFLTTWIGAAEAHHLRGWRGLLLPVAAALVVTLSSVIVNTLVQGAEFTIVTIARELGLMAR
ncbi:MAG: phage holin family protein [Chloroflexota bacterium]